MTAHDDRVAGLADAAIVDIGCGERLLADLIAPLLYPSFLGVDLSRVTIERILARATGRNAFELGGAAT